MTVTAKYFRKKGTNEVFAYNPTWSKKSMRDLEPFYGNVKEINGKLEAELADRRFQEAVDAAGAIEEYFPDETEPVNPPVIPEAVETVPAAEDAGKQEGEEDARLQIIRQAIPELKDTDKDAEGFPKVAAVSAIVGFKTSKNEISKALSLPAE